MRDTLILGTFLAVVVGFWFFMQGTATPGHSMVSSKAPVSYGSPSSKGTGASANTARQHLRSSHEIGDQKYNSETSLDGSAEGSSGRTSEVEGLPSIYSRKSVEASKLKNRPGSRKAKARANSPSEENVLAQKKNIHGVPVDQWIEWNKDRLHLGEVSEETGNGMRLFVQCMEMKKSGAKSVGQRDCRQLSANPNKLSGQIY